MRLLPMRDYPQHLFLAHLTATYQEPIYNWREFFRSEFGVPPYRAGR